MKVLKTALLGLTVLVMIACNREKPESGQSAPPAPKTKVPVPRFERDSAYAYLAKQVNFGPRVPNTETHRQTKDWLADKLRAFGAKVIEQDFQAKAYTGETLKGTNIIAQFNPEANKRVLLAAHWDTRPFADSPISEERQTEPILGADDGASGVAVLLEIARQLQQHPISMGVDIVLFDAEDYGESGGKDPGTYALGSQHWSRNPHVSGKQLPEYGILLDMVGAANARFPKEYFSAKYAPRLLNKVWKLAQNMGYSNYFVNASDGGITDDHYYVNTIARIPMIDIINRPVGTQTGFGEYWHTHKDDLDIIDKRTLRAVGQVVLAVLYRENNGDF